MMEYRKILLVCPCCGEIRRLTDLQLGGERTWLDEYESRMERLDRKEELFSEKEEALREKATERGRRAAAKAFNSAISASFKRLKYDPFDIKPILNPVDFVVFNGMDKEHLRDIIFLSSRCTPLEGIRKHVKAAIQKKRYDWQIACVDDCGGIEFK